jgi:holin-like protein
LKYLKQLLIILTAYFLGEVLHSIFHLPVPGSVLGLILLFIALYTGLVKVEMIEDVCEFLLSNMSFLFIPAGVGLMVSFGVLKGKWAAFLTIIIVSTILVWLVTVYTVKLLRKGQRNE